MTSANSGESAAVSRRSFMKTSAAIGAAIAGAPAILRAEDKAGTKPPVMGTGDHTYELVEGWGQLPAGKRFGNTHAVVESEDGRVFIHNASPTGDATCIFDPDGKFIKSWGAQYKQGAHGMDIRKEGNQEFLYLAETSQRIIAKTTLDGEVVWEKHYPKMSRDVKNGKVVPCYHEPNEKFSPTFIALAPNGDFYVTDGYGSNYVHRYNLQGEYLQTFGGPGGKPGTTQDPGKLSCPHGIWCDTREPENPMIVVADRSNVRLQWFTLDGRFIKMVTHELRHPCHFDQRGTDLLIPDLKGRVTIFDKDNNLITHLGDNPNSKEWANNRVPQKDLKPGVFCTPHGAMWDKQGNIYVVEWLPYGRVTKLRHVSA